MINAKPLLPDEAQYYTDNEVKPCSVCGGRMLCHNTAMLSGSDLHEQSHYLMACEACGYGPSQAFASIDEANQHWHAFASSDGDDA